MDPSRHTPVPWLLAGVLALAGAGGLSLWLARPPAVPSAPGLTAPTPPAQVSARPAAPPIAAPQPVAPRSAPRAIAAAPQPPVPKAPRQTAASPPMPVKPPAPVALAQAAPIQPAPTQPAPIQPAPIPAPLAPSFDVVRVSPSGAAVIAGRAAPGARVTVRAGARVIGRTTADASGAWVLLPTTPFAPGGLALSLSARSVPGGKPAAGAARLVLAVPPRPAPGVTAAPGGGPPAGVVAVLRPAGNAAPPRLLQAPTAPQGRMAVDIVTYDLDGRIRFSGHAPPGALLALAVDGRPIGRVRADAKGGWSLMPAAPLAPGQHLLLLAEIGPGGKVLAAEHLPFIRAASFPAHLAAGHVVVQPGQCLWLIARAAYGNGVDYTLIFAANRGAIRNPNLIYPGQTFLVPSPPAPSSSPASARAVQ